MKDSAVVHSTMCRGREFHNLGDNDRNENLYVSVLQKCSVNVNLCLNLVGSDVWEWNSGMHSGGD